MATFTRTDTPGNTYLYEWVLTTADATGVAISVPGASDKSIQFDGTWGGATAVMEGSNDNATFLPLTDPQGNAISKTADALEAIIENTLWVRPRLSSVGIGATISVRLLVRSTM